MAAALADVPLRAVLYARISEEEEARGTGVESTAIQIRDGLDWIETGKVDGRSMVLVAEPFIDNGISGAEWVKRKAWNRLMQLAKRRGFDIAVMRDSKRLGRDAARVTHALVELDNIGACVGYYQTKKVAELGGAGFIITAAEGFGDERERKTNNINIKRRLQENVEAGYSTGAVRFGYASVPVEGGRRNYNGQLPKRWEVDGEQARLLTRVGEAFVAAAGSYRGAALALNTAGIKSTTGGTWSHKRVRHVVTSPLYRGQLVHGRKGSTYRGGTKVATTAPHSEVRRAVRPELAIWPPALLATIDQLLARVQPRRTPAGRTKHLGSSLIRCPLCGGGMTCSGGDTGGRSYICNKKLQHGNRGCPGVGYRSEKRVNEALVRIALSLIGGDIKARALAIVRERLEAQGRADLRKVESKRLAATLSEIEREKANLARAVAKRGDLDALVVELDRVTAKGRALREELARLDAAPAKLDGRRVLVAVEKKLAALTAGEFDVAGVLATALRGGRFTATPVMTPEGKRWALRARISAGYLLALTDPNSGSPSSASDPELGSEVTLDIEEVA